MDDIYYIKDSLKIKISNEFTLTWNEIVKYFIKEKYYRYFKSIG